MSRKHQKLLLPCTVRAVPGKDRTLRFVISTERVARDGDIVRVSGWEFDDFRANPVVLAFHDHYIPAVGRVADISVVTGENPRIEADVEFAGLEQLHELAETMYALYRDGFMRAVSVGFMPLAYEDATDEQKAELGMRPWGRIVSRATLWELSVVNVPADTGALMIPDDDGQRVALAGHLRRVRSHAIGAEKEALDAVLSRLGDADEDKDDSTDSSESDVAVTRQDLDDFRAFLSAQLDELREILTPREPPPDAASGEQGAHPPSADDDNYWTSLCLSADRACESVRGAIE